MYRLQQQVGLAVLFAHVVPGYLAAALGSTVAPDLDVIYNALFRGFVNHSTLWTHSVFPYLVLAAVWLTLRIARKVSFATTMTGLIIVGGLSHLLLDVIAHRTPLVYPLSMDMIGIAPKRVVEGGIDAYLRHPIVLLEPLLFGVATAHWVWQRKGQRRHGDGRVTAIRAPQPISQ